MLFGSSGGVGTAVRIAVNIKMVPRKVVAMKRSVRMVSVREVHCRFFLELCFIRTIILLWSISSTVFGLFRTV